MTREPLRPALDRTFPFDQTKEAMAYIEDGQANGKVVVSTAPSLMR